MTNRSFIDDPQLSIGTRHIRDSLLNLNLRIARLSSALGVPLETDDDMHRILNHENGVFHNKALDEGNKDAHPNERRLLAEWEELRGLLVMRCDLMAQALTDLGHEKTLLLASEVETELTRQGFKSGADGFNLLRMLKSKNEQLESLHDVGTHN